MPCLQTSWTSGLHHGSAYIGRDILPYYLDENASLFMRIAHTSDGSLLPDMKHDEDQ